jgi:hypothetical protein
MMGIRSAVPSGTTRGWLALGLVAILALAASCAPQPASESGEEAAAPEVSRAPEPQAPKTARVTVPQGTEIRLAMSEGVNSGTSQVGDRFTATLTDPVVVGNRVVLPAGSTVHGKVTEVVPAKKGLKEKEGALAVSFDKVVTPSGRSASMSAELVSVATKSTKKTAGIIGGSAAGGALLGKVLGKDTKDAAVGAVIGGAIGTGIAAGTKGEEVEIPVGSEITINLDQPLAITVEL